MPQRAVKEHKKYELENDVENTEIEDNESGESVFAERVGKVWGDSVYPSFWVPTLSHSIIEIHPQPFATITYAYR